MTRRFIAAPLAAALALALVTPAFAGGPSRDPVPGDELHFAAGDVCTFPVEMIVESHAYVLTFETWQLFTGFGAVTVTNEWTQDSLHANISGPAKYVYEEDGSISISGGGPWLIFNFAGDPWGAGMWLTAGRIHVEIEADETMSSLTLLGHRTDVCARLG